MADNLIIIDRALATLGGSLVTDAGGAACCCGGGSGPCGVVVGPGCPCGTCGDFGGTSSGRAAILRTYTGFLETEAFLRYAHCCFSTPRRYSYEQTGDVYGFDPATGQRGPLLGSEVTECRFDNGSGLCQTWDRATNGATWFNEYIVPACPNAPGEPGPAGISTIIFVEQGEPVATNLHDGSWFTSCDTASWDIWVRIRVSNLSGPPAFYDAHVRGSSSVDLGAEACGTGCPTGACCCNGVCYGGTTFLECQLMGGRFAGPGSLCIDVDCLGRGACCKPDGSCTFTDPVTCIRGGGIYHGRGVRCGEAMCPQPMGICCSPTGCRGQTTQANCPPPSQWYAHAADCSVCILPPPIRPCCFADGSCAMLTGDNCIAQGGTWQMNGTTCEAAGCMAQGGACCYQDVNSHGQLVWTCSDGPGETQSGCDSRMGTFYPGLTCDQINCPIMPGNVTRLMLGVGAPLGMGPGGLL